MLSQAQPFGVDMMLSLHAAVKAPRTPATMRASVDSYCVRYTPYTEPTIASPVGFIHRPLYNAGPCKLREEAVNFQ